MLKPPPFTYEHFKKFSEPPFCYYISQVKVYESPHFLDLILSASAHAESSGDYSRVCKIVNFFPENIYRDRTMKWFSERLAISFTIHPDGRVNAKRNRKATPRLVNAAELFPEADRARRSSSFQASEKRPKPKAETTDLMDKGLRLPGSFENGKRR